MDEAACLAHIAKAAMPALCGAVEALPSEALDALRAVRERVAQDRLPLLSLLEAEPLRMQSSHLSFQEYFAARAVCTGKHRLPEGSPPPWQWPQWWANAVRLGVEMGDAFGRGVLQAAGVAGAALDLKGKLGGDRPTTVAVVVHLMRGLASLDLSSNSLGVEEAKVLLGGLAGSGTLTECNVRGNQLDVESAMALAKVATEKRVMLFGIKHDQTEAYFLNKGLGAVDAVLIANDICVSRSLTQVCPIQLSAAL